MSEERSVAIPVASQSVDTDRESVGESSDADQLRGTSSGRCAKGFAYFLAFVALWNCVKIPFYIVLDPATAVRNSTTLPFGMENSVPLYYAFGYHGSKQAFNPQLFLAPHTAMGSSFFVMSAAYLLGSARFEPMLAVQCPFNLCGIGTYTCVHICIQRSRCSRPLRSSSRCTRSRAGRSV